MKFIDQLRDCLKCHGRDLPDSITEFRSANIKVVYQDHSESFAEIMVIYDMHRRDMIPIASIFIKTDIDKGVALNLISYLTDLYECASHNPIDSIGFHDLKYGVLYYFNLGNDFSGYYYAAIDPLQEEATPVYYLVLTDVPSSKDKENFKAMSFLSLFSLKEYLRKLSNIFV